MKKIVVFTTALLVLLLIALGIIVANGNISDNGGILDQFRAAVRPKPKEVVQETETEGEVPSFYYDGHMLVLNSQKEMITYEGNEFRVKFINPFYDEESENYIRVTFYDQNHALLMNQIGVGDDSVFFDVYRTTDGCMSWEKCASDLWLKNGERQTIQMLSDHELIYMHDVVNELMGNVTTVFEYSADFGDTWVKLDGIGDPNTENDILKQMAEMSLEEKVANLFMLTPEILTDNSRVLHAGNKTYSCLEKYPIAGLLYTRKNVDDKYQLRELTQTTQEYAMEISGYPLLMAVEEEGGDATVLGGNGDLDEEDRTVWSMTVLGRSGDPKQAYKVGADLGEILDDYGFNMDLAPVADILGGNSRAMSSRIISTNAQMVSDIAIEVMSGLEDQGILPVMKYFPGYGTANIKGDDFPINHSTKEEMLAKDFLPYINAIDHGVKFIMVGHVSVPKVVGDNTPASLSEVMITDILRNELGYQGVIMTDRLDDEAMQASYSSGEAALAAFNAGADLLLCPADFEEAYEAILNAAQKGKIDSQRLDQSVYRILSMRASVATEE